MAYLVYLDQGKRCICWWPLISVHERSWVLRVVKPFITIIYGLALTQPHVLDNWEWYHRSNIEELYYLSNFHWGLHYFNLKIYAHLVSLFFLTSPAFLNFLCFLTFLCLLMLMLSVALDSDVFEERRNGWKSFASNNSNMNATDEVKSLQQMTDGTCTLDLASYTHALWTLHVILLPWWALVGYKFLFINEVNIFQSVKLDECMTIYDSFIGL